MKCLATGPQLQNFKTSGNIMTTFTNEQLSTSEQTGFIGNIDGNDIFAIPFADGTYNIIMNKGGDILAGLEVTTKFPAAYALFLIKGFKGNVVIDPNQVAKKDRIPMTASTRREVEEAISRFNLGVSTEPIKSDTTTSIGDNTSDIEDVLNTLDPNYRISSYLKLRGHIGFKAAKLAGQFLAKQAKALMDHNQETGLDAFNAAMGYLRGQSTDDLLLSEMGLEVGTDMLHSLTSLVMYSNKLNFDLQELVDPTGKKREDSNWKFLGVFFDENGRRASWHSTVARLADKQDGDEAYKASGSKLPREQWEYETYTKGIDNNAWRLTFEEWTEIKNADDKNLYDKYEHNIVDLLCDIGPDECNFDDLPVRAQIGAIENMRGKLDDILIKALKSVRYTPGVTDRMAEASKVKGLINGFNKSFCSMLSSSRYANYTEFMYNFTPTVAAGNNTPTSRRMIARNEKINEVKATTRKTHIEEDDLIEDMESDIL